MTIVTDPRAMQETAQALRAAGHRIAFVPTMGALHDGHLALFRAASAMGDRVVGSVFVNPTQFGAGEDFERYPRNLETDAAMAEGAGCSMVFAPTPGSMYPMGFSTFVNVEGLTAVLEGRSRPGHFRGVATVVAKLLHIVAPHVVVFGQKDAQQVVVIRRMVEDLNLNVTIEVVPTVRAHDGLALSSRNAFLTPAQRAEATVLYGALQDAEQRIHGGERAAETIRSSMAAMITGSSSGIIDYVSVAHGRSLQELDRIPSATPLLLSLAVRFGSTRLIDNVPLTV